jgi:hypothetical protein
MKKLMLILALVGNAFAGYQTTGNIQVSRFDAYDDFGGGGDIAIWAATAVAQCPDGVYIKGTMPGKSTMFSMVMLAASVNKPIKAYVLDTDIWTGTSGKKLCMAKAIMWGQ